MPLDNEAAANLLDVYISEEELARQRKVSTRSLRAERQRGDGPPWAKFDNRIYYPEADFRGWLKDQVRRPVRTRKVA